jgi:UDP-N-acetyl-2-amino-2-deoxyglucuronate dehydrogenase
MGSLRFGIIGCGLISNWHADAILEIEGTQLVGATDVSEKSRVSFASKYNILAFDSVDELLLRNDIDVVCICTPSGLHAPLSIQAANAGKHIIVEKPMAITIEQADGIIEACEKNNVKAAVISQSRFSDVVVKLKDTVDKGLLGKLITGDAQMKFYRSQEYYDSGGWRGTWSMDGGGALMNQGIHNVDILSYIMGPVKNIFAYTRTLARKIEVEDTAVALLEYENGALGIIQATTSIYPGLPRRLEVNGDKGSITIEGSTFTNWSIEGREVPADVKLGKGDRSSASDPGAFGIEGHIRQISDMVDAIKNDRRPLVDQHQGKIPIEIILAIYESSKTGKMVKLGK